jgi:predicted NBD/HSP70 family sugar kinase
MRDHVPAIAVIEIGGTTVRVARFDPVSQTLVNRCQTDAPNYLSGETRAEELQQRLLEVIGGLVDANVATTGVDVVSIAYPGPVNVHGIAQASPTLFGPGAAPYPIREACQRRWPEARIVIANDLTAAGYRYAALGHHEFCVLTVGSGIGHKLFVDGRPLLGVRQRGGEIGHLRLDLTDEALLCDCGARGHLGALASGRGTIALTRRRALDDRAGFAASSLSRTAGTPTGVNGENIAAAFVAGDAWVAAAVRMASSYLGQALAAIHLAVGVEDFILLGGFSRALGDAYLRLVVEAAEAACWNVGQRWVDMISLGIPDDDDGLIGAGLLAMTAEGTR